MQRTVVEEDRGQEAPPLAMEPSERHDQRTEAEEVLAIRAPAGQLTEEHQREDGQEETGDDRRRLGPGGVHG